MKRYLLDTNIIVFLFRNKHEIDKKIASCGQRNCFISEITLAELKLGAEKSSQPVHNHFLIEQLITIIQVIPITKSLDIFAKEKIRLEKRGTPMHDNFDVLIAATALYHDFTLVTNNTKHFILFQDLIMEDWVTIK
jgi:tRNA(fMet)-specific endonuclease VapC